MYYYDGRGIDEYDKKYKLILKWVYIFFCSFVQSCIMCVACIVIGLYLIMLFPYKNNIIICVFILLFCGGLLGPAIIFKIDWTGRVVKYYIISLLGDKIEGELINIDDTSRCGVLLLTFYYNYENKGLICKGKCRVSCLDIDISVLNLDRLYGKYIISEHTKIPLAIYKGKTVILHNKCGFYDIAHYKGATRIRDYF